MRVKRAPSGFCHGLDSAIPYLLLSHGANLFRSRLGPGGLRWVNAVSGAIIAVFGLGALSSGLIS